VATSFVLKQKKQKFKSPPYASFAAQGLALQNGAAPRLFIFCPEQDCRLTLYLAKSKRPLPLRTGHHVLPSFHPKLGGDEKKKPLANLPR
jgi:hypothetical protein